MVRHMIIWNFADGFTDAQNRKNAERIKKELEALAGLIDGIVSLDVIIDNLPSGNGDILLDSTFENLEALNGYLIHPTHQKAAEFVRSVTKNRMCLDYYLGDKSK